MFIRWYNSQRGVNVVENNMYFSEAGSPYDKAFKPNSRVFLIDYLVDCGSKVNTISEMCITRITQGGNFRVCFYYSRCENLLYSYQQNIPYSIYFTEIFGDKK